MLILRQPLLEARKTMTGKERLIFGDDVRTEIADNDHFAAAVKVSVSQTLSAWAFQFTGGIRITGPATVKEQYRQCLKLQRTENLSRCG